MTRTEAMEILKLYNNWNENQTSVEFACRGKRTQVDDVLDARRKLLIHACEVLRSTEPG